MTPGQMQPSIESSEDDRKSTGTPDVRNRMVLVTGATSLLGRLVTAELLNRGCSVLALLRPSSPYDEASLATSFVEAAECNWKRLTVTHGDVWEPDLGLGSDVLTKLGDITEIIHLARPRATEEPLLGARVKGLDGVIDVARRLGGIRRLVVLSSTDVVGDYIGRFYEDWLDVAQTLSTQKAREVLETEARAREAASYLPLCVVRHSLLVGHSKTGQIECSAGFDRLFALGRYVSKLPSFIRIPGPAAGKRFIVCGEQAQWQRRVLFI